jgi:hypothetical protein
MAFLRVERKSSGQYLRIMESFRDADGEPSNKILYNLGKVEDYTPEQLQRFGTKFIELGGGDAREIFTGDIEELGRYNYGYIQAVSKLLSIYGLDALLDRIKRRHRVQFNLLNAVQLMLAERFHEPASKLSNYQHQDDYIGLGEVSLHHLYRSLDHLASNQELIQAQIYNRGRDLFNQDLDVVFYDVTTLYFESEKEIEGMIRQKGYGKDGKIGSTQILFGLLVDKNKAPIGYRIYKGNTYEGDTFASALRQLKEQYKIDKIVVVADRGMLSAKNISLTNTNEYQFIVGERLKALPQSVQSFFLQAENYRHEWIYTHEGEEIPVQYCTYTYNGRTIIGTYSENRARKDAHEREKRIKKAEKLLTQPSTLKKKARYYFLTGDKDEHYQLDEEKIRRDAQYDGYLAISTNTEYTIEEALSQYRNLYKIEQTFRTFKSFLEARPMFHWTDRRIEGHICLCYIAYALLHVALDRLERAGMKHSERDLRDGLDRLQVSLIESNGNRYYLRSAKTEETAGLINKLGLKKLPNVVPENVIFNYI